MVGSSGTPMEWPNGNIHELAKDQCCTAAVWAGHGAYWVKVVTWTSTFIEKVPPAYVYIQSLRDLVKLLSAY